MNFTNIILGICGGYCLYQTFLIGKASVRRWKLGRFKAALWGIPFTILFLLFAVFAMYGIKLNIEQENDYKRAGIENVDLIGSGEREGFDYPIAAYTETDSGKLCVGMLVDGEEVVREIECFEPPEQND